MHLPGTQYVLTEWMALEGPYSQLPGAGAPPPRLPLVDSEGLRSGRGSATDPVCGPREAWRPG